MIVVDEGEWLRVITQPDHARFSAALLSLWRAGGLAVHPRRAALLFAVREHDNGWQEVDSAPAVDPHRRRPFEFTELPATVRRQIWERGIERYAATTPYTALLIAAHAEAVHRPMPAPVRDLLDELEPRRQQWLEQIGLNAATLAGDYRWLRLADSLSLTACTGSDDWSSDLDLESRMEGRTLYLRPFPLAGATRFEVSMRRIPNRPYDRDAELGSVLARARWTELPIRVAPL